MQKERLIVKNFFTLKNVDIELAKFNIFIGEQASGKSLLVKLIDCFRSILLLSIKHSTMDKVKLNNLFVKTFCDIFNLGTSNLNSEVIYFLNDARSVNITIKNGIVTIFLSDEQNNELVNNTPDSTEYGIEKLSKDIILAPFLPAARASFLTVFSNVFNLLKTVLSEKINLDQTLITFGQEYQNSLFNFNQADDNIIANNFPLFAKYYPRILKGSYVHDNMGGFINQDGFQTRPLYASSGQQEFLPVYIVLRNYLLSKHEHGRIYIEEPEAHLYPTAQKDILELLVYIINMTNSDSLCITTHSPYILTVLNNLITANEIKDKKLTHNTNLLVPFEEVRAYLIDGTAKSLMNQEYRIIDAEKLDDISDSISKEYSEMVNLL